MTWRSPFILFALTGFAFAGVQPLPKEDPPPCVVKNATSGGLFGTVYSIRVSDQPAPVGIIKIYDMDNNMLGVMQGPGDAFNVKPGQVVKVAVCADPEARQGSAAITLEFAKASTKDEPPKPDASVTFKHITPGSAPPAIAVSSHGGKVKVDEAAYLSSQAETPFVTLGKN